MFNASLQLVYYKHVKLKIYKVLLLHLVQVAQVAGGQQPEEGDVAATPRPVPPDRGPLPRLCQEGLRLQLLVRER